jgi:hypothetical protein
MNAHARVCVCVCLCIYVGTDDEYVPLDKEVYRALTTRLVAAMPAATPLGHRGWMVPGTHSLNSSTEGRAAFVHHVLTFAQELVG